MAFTASPPNTIERMPVGMAMIGIQKKISVVTPHVIALEALRCTGRTVEIPSRSASWSSAARGPAAATTAESAGREIAEPLRPAVTEHGHDADRVERG